MPAPPVFGLASGQDHNATIEKLMQIERIPIRRMQRETEFLEFKKKAWDEVRNRVRRVADASRILYSFVGPFTLKKIISSDPGAITGEASTSVTNTEQRIKVIQLATNHHMRSNKIDREGNIPAGKFSLKIGEKTILFPFSGGKITDLVRLLNSRGGPEYFDVFNTQVDEKNNVIALRSKKSGKEGELIFDDPDGIIRGLGLIKPGEGEKKRKEISIQRDMLEPYSRLENSPESAAIASENISVEKNSVVMNGPGAVLIKNKIPSGSRLLFQYRREEATDPAKSAKESGATDKDKKGAKVQVLRDGPELEANVEDVHLKGYNITRLLEIPGGPDAPEGEAQKKVPEGDRTGVGLVWEKDGKIEKKEILIEKPDEAQEIDIEKISGDAEIQSFYSFSEKGGKHIFEKIAILEGTGPGKGMVAANEIVSAQDAKLEIQGIEVSRPNNRGIKDIIDGASLNLHRPTEGTVDVTITADTEKIIDKIREWVAAYNELIKFCRENSKAGNSDDLSRERTIDEDNPDRGFEEIRSKSGIFVSDSTIRSLIHKLQIVTSSAYRTPATDQFHVLSDIGISTGQPNRRWEDIQSGLLEIDEAKLISVLEDSSEGVRELFSSDTNEDNRIDDGVAYSLEKTLDPFGRGSGGLIDARIQSLETQIADNKTTMNNKEMSMKMTESKLRQKFGTMENAIQRSKSTQNFLRQRLPGFGGGSGRD